MTDTTTRVCEIVAAVLSEHHLFRPDLDVTPESDLDDMNADSIDRVGIALRVESEFGFIISDAQESAWASVSDIISTVEQREKAAA